MVQWTVFYCIAYCASHSILGMPLLSSVHRPLPLSLRCIRETSCDVCVAVTLSSRNVPVYTVHVAVTLCTAHQPGNFANCGPLGQRVVPSCTLFSRPIKVDRCANVLSDIAYCVHVGRHLPSVAVSSHTLPTFLHMYTLPFQIERSVSSHVHSPFSDGVVSLFTCALHLFRWSGQFPVSFTCALHLFRWSGQFLHVCALPFQMERSVSSCVHSLL